MNDREYRVLERYLKGDDVREEDKYILHKFENIHYVKTGYRRENGKVYETAILTDLGRMVYYNERTLRNPIRRILHYIFEI